MPDSMATPSDVAIIAPASTRSTSPPPIAQRPTEKLGA